MAGKHRSAVSEEEPSWQSMLIANSFVITNVYVNRNQVETFGGIGRCLCLANSSVVTSIYLDRNKVRAFGGNRKCLCLANFFVVTSVYLNQTKSWTFDGRGRCLCLAHIDHNILVKAGKVVLWVVQWYSGRGLKSHNTARGIAECCIVAFSTPPLVPLYRLPHSFPALTITYCTLRGQVKGAAWGLCLS